MEENHPTGYSRLFQASEEGDDEPYTVFLLRSQPASSRNNDYIILAEPQFTFKLMVGLRGNAERII